MGDTYARLPSVEETLSHPAYPTTVWNLEPDRKGVASVAETRGGPFRVTWEIHGTGPSKILFVMGVGGTRRTWQQQTKHFGHDHGEEYSVLVLDNRGQGESDKPFGRYTTSELALDLIDVLDQVGWTDDRSVHLVGISLGGMIAQEIAHAAPHRLRSLSLICTTSAMQRSKSFMEELAQRSGVLFPKSEYRSAIDTARQIFNEEWLLAPDESLPPVLGTTPKCAPPRNGGTEYLRFDNNFQRFLAGELTKRRDPGFYSKMGIISQLMAAGGHYKSPEQLKAIADVVGRESIMVLHGTGDNMIGVENGKTIMKIMEPGTAMVVENMSHTPVLDRPHWFNNLLQEKLTKWDSLEGGK
ncbi:hypothetical protein NLU13_1110 [Sarocladium strictum]|uniref:AB hydrolase-1 domain-containing protein n=1 Tax=Sarocladium strictum TaxID=5046 RepID=A0AA39LC23_SARSR|nr:hypothetical protein NLU13_1110 [Sarocladium strictum]